MTDNELTMPAGREITAERVWHEYEKGMAFNVQINLPDTVRVNEDFFIGKQWEGVNSNGLPKPVFNFIKRIVLYLVATTATDNVAMAASPLSDAYPTAEDMAPGVETVKSGMDLMCELLGGQYDALFEHNKITSVIRDLMRDAAVRGDGCLYSYFDAEAETGQDARGALKIEMLENTRVHFGDPNTREVQEQPYILVTRRERLDKVRREMKENSGDPDQVKAEDDELSDRFDRLTDDKITTITRFWKDGKGSVWCVKTVKDAIVRRAWETGMTRYPFVWLSWERVTNCYHGQAAVTGLIPNQVFVNKIFALTMISLMTTAYPKIVFDKSRISVWDSGVGKAIGVSGDVTGVAKAIDPATVSPQIAQFIEMAVAMTKELCGATDAALGNERPKNASAILALQKASSVPMELVKQGLYQAIEDLGRIWLDQMGAFYGQRLVKLDGQVQLFDFGQLRGVPLSLKLDVGGSAYWSEIAQLQTLDNLLSGGHITILEYLERLPRGYISNQQELMDAIRERMAMAQAGGIMPPQQEAAPAVAPEMQAFRADQPVMQI